MKDKLGTEIGLGDIIVSAASRDGGYLRVGKVYGFAKDGLPLVVSRGSKYDYTARKHVAFWRRGVSGTGIIVLAKPDGFGMTQPIGLYDEIFRDYDAEVPE